MEDELLNRARSRAESLRTIVGLMRREGLQTVDLAKADAEVAELDTFVKVGRRLKADTQASEKPSLISLSEALLGAQRLSVQPRPPLRGGFAVLVREAIAEVGGEGSLGRIHGWLVEHHRIGPEKAHYYSVRSALNRHPEIEKTGRGTYRLKSPMSHERQFVGPTS